MHADVAALLRRCESSHLRLRNALYRSPPWRDAGVTWRWTAAPAQQALYRITLQRQEQRLCLDLIDDVIGLGDTLDDWMGLPEPARLVVWTLAHERFIDLLQRVFGRDWLPQAIEIDRAHNSLPPLPHIDAGFEIDADDGRVLIRGVATFALPLCSHLNRRAQRHPTASPSPWAAGRVRLRCVIDRVRASARDLQRLAPRAIVLLDNATLAGPSGRVQLVAGNTVFDCELRGLHGTGLLVRATSSGGHTMVEAVSPSGIPLHDDALDATDTLTTHELPVTLSFEAGSVSIPFDQLASVRPGFVFELGAPLDASLIRVLANGVEVGAGELVRIDDQLGVRLTQITAAQRKA
jgi:type III secretion system YscQ/HrcQ family protein